MSMDSTIVATALYSLHRGLQTSINWAEWTITAYSFGFVLMLPLSDKLSERYGRRRVVLGSVVAFTTASLFCGLATNIYMLIALRALQAAGGAGFTPSATWIVVDHFGPVRDRAVSLFGSIFPVAAMTGPILLHPAMHDHNAIGYESDDAVRSMPCHIAAAAPGRRPGTT